MVSSDSEKLHPSKRSVLLGCFVLFQVIYIPLANLIQLVPRELPTQKSELDIQVQREGTATNSRILQQAINNLGTAIDRYGELTGQVQAWSLFAPDFGTQTVLPVVDCVFDDQFGISKLTSVPKQLAGNVNSYFRRPGPYSRLYSYDYLIAVIYLNYSAQALNERGDEWRAAVFERVRLQQRSLQAWFRLNLQLFRETRPDLQVPRAMTLSVRVIPSPAPGQSERAASFVVPLARWHPDRTPEADFLPVEAYDPVMKEFVRLPVEHNGP